MKNSIFLSFCLFIVTLIVSAHALLRQGLDPTPAFHARLEAIEKEKHQAEFKAQLAAQELADYQQNLATLVPEALKGKNPSAPDAFRLRQLASVVGASDQLEIERASGLMEKAKTAFRLKDFERADSLFQSLIETYPTSSYVAEAHFLLAEGQYQLKDFEASVATVEKMIDLFPENELTGFALLRLGHIFEAQDRLEDASDVYRAVLLNFKHADIVKQAKISLREIAL